MRDQVCQLQQAGLLHTCKIGDVGEVVDSSPGRTPLAEVVYPDFGSLVESTFCKYQQSPLRIVLLVASVCQKTSQLSESKWYVPIFEWRRFIIFGRIKVILTVYRLI